jgi:site-specific DNA recombinase
MARLIDSYAEGLIDKQEFEPRVTRLRERTHHLEEQLQHLKEEEAVEEELRPIVGRLETFAIQVKDGLQQADFQTRREIIRALVKRVEVDEQQIRVVFRVSPTSPLSSSEAASPNWQHCGGRVDSCTFHPDRTTFFLSEPCTQCKQICRLIAKAADFFVPLPRFNHTQTHDEKVLMHIDTCTPLIHHFHL